jgi:hypothetical protein
LFVPDQDHGPPEDGFAQLVLDIVLRRPHFDSSTMEMRASREEVSVADLRGQRELASSSTSYTASFRDIHRS